MVEKLTFPVIIVIVVNYYKKLFRLRKVKHLPSNPSKLSSGGARQVLVKSLMNTFLRSSVGRAFGC